MDKNNIDAIIESSPKQNKKSFTYITNCEKCGKEFSQITTQYLINNKRCKRFCSRSCANSHVRTEDSKKKVSESLNNFYRVNGISRNPLRAEDCKNSILRRVKREESPILVNCKFCNKEIYTKLKFGSYCYECAEEHNLPNLLLYTKDGKIMPSKKRRESSRRAQLKLVAEGRHKGWQSRNIVSYPEKFWQEVLKNNNISYSFNHPVKKSDLGVKDDDSNYFLDFLIGENFDLEIDGKQHSYKERKESDALRDELLNKNGYIVYRIKWNEIVSDRGKLLMEQKIDNFLKFYKQHFKLISEL